MCWRFLDEGLEAAQHASRIYWEVNYLFFFRCYFWRAVILFLVGLTRAEIYTLWKMTNDGMKLTAVEPLMDSFFGVVLCIDDEHHVTTHRTALQDFLLISLSSNTDRPSPVTVVSFLSRKMCQSQTPPSKGPANIRHTVSKPRLSLRSFDSGSAGRYEESGGCRGGDPGVTQRRKQDFFVF